MNLFYLDRDPVLCAQMHHDKHVIKMTTELGIMLSSVLQFDHSLFYHSTSQTPGLAKRRIIDLVPIDRNALYRVSHLNHPSVKWCSKSPNNFRYAYELFCELAKEYTHRFGKTHATYSRLHPTISEHMSGILVAMGKYCKPLFLGSKPSTSFYFYAPPQVVPESYQWYKGRGTFFQDKKVMLHYANCATMVAYRRFYLTFKDAKWTKREPPEWFTNPAFLQKYVYEVSTLASSYNILSAFPTRIRDSIFRSSRSYSESKARYLVSEDTRWRNYQRNKLENARRLRVQRSLVRGDLGIDPSVEIPITRAQLTTDYLDSLRYTNPIYTTNFTQPTQVITWNTI